MFITYCFGIRDASESLLYEHFGSNWKSPASGDADAMQILVGKSPTDFLKGLALDFKISSSWKLESLDFLLLDFCSGELVDFSFGMSLGTLTLLFPQFVDSLLVHHKVDHLSQNHDVIPTFPSLPRAGLRF